MMLALGSGYAALLHPGLVLMIRYSVPLSIMSDGPSAL